jgi:hypothetical protein
MLNAKHSAELDAQNRKSIPKGKYRFLTQTVYTVVSLYSLQREAMDKKNIPSLT